MQPQELPQLMRRSVVRPPSGSLLAALVGGLGLVWLTGVVFGQKTYSIRLRPRCVA